MCERQSGLLFRLLAVLHWMPLGRVVSIRVDLARSRCVISARIDGARFHVYEDGVGRRRVGGGRGDARLFKQVRSAVATR